MIWLLVIVILILDCAMNKNCKVCDYLLGFGSIRIEDYLNSKIFNNISYKNFTDECLSIKIKNVRSIPSKHYIDKHKSNCLQDFTPIVEVEEEPEKDKKEDDQFIVLPDGFKEKTLFNKNKDFQDMLLQLLYVQLKIAVDLNYNVSKDQIKNIKDLHDLAFQNCLDLSVIDSNNITKNKNELENVGLKVIQHVMNNTISTEKEALDIGKFLLHNKLEDVKTEELQTVHTLEECIEIADKLLPASNILELELENRKLKRQVEEMTGK